MKRTRAVLVAPKQFDFVQEEIPKLKENEVLYRAERNMLRQKKSVLKRAGWPALFL